jgi:acetyltransferase-like isoleucine patch superfamily enzyme
MHWSDAVQGLRIAWYRRFWTCAEVQGAPILRAPAVLAGAGGIHFGAEVTLGWRHSPGFLAGYTYLEAREPGGLVTFGERCHLNNGVTIISEASGISIGKRCLIGPGVHIYDSDFHALDAGERATALPLRAPVTIADDVFVGSNAIILKGATIGAGCVVGAGAVVGADVPAGAIVAGNPARVVQR